MSAIVNDCVLNQPNQQTTTTVHQNLSQNINYRTPLDDPKYLLQNAHCFQDLRDVSTTKKKFNKKEKKDIFTFTTQYLFGCYMPPYYSVLNFDLMNKLVAHIENPNGTVSKVLTMYKGIIEHEKELFMKWLSNNWEENCKNRRLNIIPHVEDYIKSAYNFSNNYIKTHYNGTYRSKIKIMYNREDDIVTNKVEMTYCQRLKPSDIMYVIKLPSINITNLQSKVSFTSSVYKTSEKIPFIQDELCRTLSNEHGSDVNICLSSIKHIMNLEKPNSIWIIPIHVEIDTNNHKTIYVGGALSTGHYSQSQKSYYYLRKEIKRKFRKMVTKTANTDETIQINKNKYNYDQWTLKLNETDNVNNKSFNLIVRSKPHIQHREISNELYERVLIPKLEYQPEFGFEKLDEEQIIEYWLDTYFRNPKCNYTLVSVQYNMDIMMNKQKNVESSNLISDDKKQMYLQRLYLTIEKFSQLDKGEYVMLHNPKNPFQNEVYQSSMYGGFNLLNMYFVLQQSEISNSLTWNPIDPEVICPIHKHFKVAPCMFKPNNIPLNIQMITKQVDQFNSAIELQQQKEKNRLANRKKIKTEKNRAKKKLERENDILYKMKRKTNSLLNK